MLWSKEHHDLKDACKRSADLLEAGACSLKTKTACLPVFCIKLLYKLQV